VTLSQNLSVVTKKITDANTRPHSTLFAELTCIHSHRVGLCSSNVLELYSVGTWFDSQPSCWKSWLIHFIMFLCFFMWMPGQYLEITHDCLFLNADRLSIHNYLLNSFSPLELSGSLLFNIQWLCILPRVYYGFRIILRISSDYFPKQHQTVGLCNEDALCFLCCRNYILDILYMSFGIQSVNFKNLNNRKSVIK
jgi:hypothetical protein